MAEKGKKKKEEEKPVEEILKEQGVVAPREKEEAEEEKEVKAKPEMSNLVMKIEKLQAVVNTVKELGSGRDERINELAENIGEIRSLLFQRDATISEMESKVEKLEETMKEVEPRKIEKKMEKRQENIEKIKAQLEKIESVQNDLSKRIRKSEKILDNIKSMENLTKVAKDIEDKIDQIEDMKDSTKRNAAKAERFYLEMGKKLDEFETVKEDVDKLDEMTKELMRSIDENRIQLDSRITKKELDKTVEEITKIPEAGKEDRIKGLQEKKGEIQSLLKRLEEQKEDKIISESSYEEIYQKNKALLEEIDEELRELESGEGKNLQDWVKGTNEKIKKIKEELKLSKVKQRKFEGKMDDLNRKLSDIDDNLVEINKKIKKGVEVPEKEAREKEERPSPKKENLMNKKREIIELLKHIEDEYRKGNISEKAYNEIKSKNLQKIEEVEKQLEEETGKEEKGKEEKTELDVLEEKISSLGGKERKELESLLMLAKEKLSRGYPLLSKKYVRQIKERLRE